MATPMESLIALAHDKGDLDDEEMAIFSDFMLENSDPILHRDYAAFDINRFNEQGCDLNFRFDEKSHIFHLARAMRLPEWFVCKNGTVAERIEGYAFFYVGWLTQIAWWIWSPCPEDRGPN